MPFIHLPERDEKAHICAPPTKPLQYRMPQQSVSPGKLITSQHIRRPDAPIGTIWRCDTCRSFWEVKQDMPMQGQGYSAPYWEIPDPFKYLKLMWRYRRALR